MRDTRRSRRSSGEPGRWRTRTGISRLELAAAAAAVVVLAGLVVAEPAILEAPFENVRTVGFVLAGTIGAGVALAVMLRVGVPAPIRLLVLGVPFVAVSWWLVSPFFVDDVVDDDFETSIELATRSSAPTGDGPVSVATTVDRTGAAPVSELPRPAGTTAPASTGGSGAVLEGPVPPDAPADPATEAEPGPALLGAGRFVGLAGHEGTGDAGIFRLADGSHVLRLENLDIQNGPDLRLYVVPGADQTSPVDGSLYLGELRGNVGDLTYPLAVDVVPTVGPWTVLVWCEAFSVEFVGASISIT